MSGHFMRGGRHAFVQQMTRHAHTSASSSSRMSSRIHSSFTSSTPFTITFTSPAAMLLSSSSSSYSTPITSSSQSPLIGSTNSSSIRASSSKAGGQKGCGAAACCQGASQAINAGEDGEEPFIGGPSLSLSSKRSTTVTSTHPGSTDPSMNNNDYNNSNSSNNAAAASNASAATPSSTPSPPRVKCDPYEQNGIPLDTDTVLAHMSVTLDSAWQYDTEKKILVRSFEFGRVFRDEFSTPKEDTHKLFAFLQDIGHIQEYNPHGVYNLNVNLRANSVQVMLRTVSLRGISYQDLMLGTKIDGIWWRLMQEKEERDMKQKKAQSQPRPAQL